jgi:hypothetical protein
MRRRDLIKVVAGSAVTWPLAARAQQRAPLRVGAVSVQSRSAPIYVAFANRMAELGYEEGKNFTFEFVQAPNVAGYRPAFQELVSRGVDIVMATGPEGPRLTQIYRQEARLVAQIFHGANPADIPVEQPARFELVINLKAAKAIGVEVPASLVARADKLIE